MAPSGGHFMHQTKILFLFPIGLSASAQLDLLEPDVKLMLMNVPQHPVITVEPALICPKVTGKNDHFSLNCCSNMYLIFKPPFRL